MSFLEGAVEGGRARNRIGVHLAGERPSASKRRGGRFVLRLDARERRVGLELGRVNSELPHGPSVQRRATDICEGAEGRSPGSIASRLC